MNYYKLIFLMLVLVFQSCQEQEKQSETEEESNQNVMLYTIGDSTMADKPDPNENPERGWCQLLPQFLNDNIALENHAVNGRSTRSFIDEKKWEAVYHKLNKGDYVFIQFGHNDQKENSPKRYTNAHTAYRNNLIKFVEQTREKGANPVLFTSIVRRTFNTDSTLVDTHGAYPLEVRLVAQDYEVPLIDLQYLTELLEESYGVEASRKLHLHYTPNEISYYPEGKEDDTHLSVLGATEVAKLAVTALKDKVEGFDRYLKK
ncbi:rhamnogalacturonan acetylesterase [Sediminibacter sp. Hel_I_10]|uniref:rhamnogalacturonan acetylesterase n=1 Tax=Sediminibacter sp. Hel_I_10 TaxID=1392490 RepID=UPI00047DB778|nr:rhamnogalacturonan acetylesterase [Sediminibacter sp. Hel_I_10]